MFQARSDAQKPIEFKAGSMGNGLPRRNLVVSPLHRMILAGSHVRQTFGVSEVLAPAKALIQRSDIRRMQGKRQIEYYSLLFDRHEIIFAEGTPTESFRPGPVAMAGFENHIREQIFEIYPGLRAEPEKGLGPAARKLITRRQAEDFISLEQGREATLEAT